MVAEDAIGEGLRGDPVARVGLPQQDRASGGRMVDPDGGAGQPPLEVRVVFAKVV